MNFMLQRFNLTCAAGQGKNGRNVVGVCVLPHSVSLVPTLDTIHTSKLVTNREGVDKKHQLDVTFVFFISLLIVAQHVSGNHVPIIRS
jgi:hypothetical protein